MKEDDAIDALRRVKTVFDRYDIEFWLDGGALLGAMRNGKLIPWDNDIDLCTWQKNVSGVAPDTDAYKELYDAGCELYFLDDKVVIEKNDYPMNVSLFRLADDKAIRTLPSAETAMGKFFRSLWWLFSVSYYGGFRIAGVKSTAKVVLVKVSGMLPTPLRKTLAGAMLKIAKVFDCREICWTVPAHFFMDLSTIDFYGMEIKVPAETEKYLSFRYGRDWKIARKEWSTLKEDGAAKT